MVLSCSYYFLVFIYVSLVLLTVFSFSWWFLVGLVVGCNSLWFLVVLFNSFFLWSLVIFGVFLWFLVVLRFLVVLGVVGGYWCLLVFVGLLLVVGGDSWWFLVVLGFSLKFLVILVCSWLFIESLIMIISLQTPPLFLENCDYLSYVFPLFID